MRTQQLLASEIDALRELSNVATSSAATALAAIVGSAVDVTVPEVHVLTLGAAQRRVVTSRGRGTVVLVPAAGDVSGSLAIVLPAWASTLLVERWGGSPLDKDMRQSALRELGNVLGSAWLQSFGLMTRLRVRPGVPMVGSEDVAALIELPLASASSDDDAVVVTNTYMRVSADADFPQGLRLQVLFLPEPGVLARVFRNLDLRDSHARLEIPVGMGELAVTARPGDVLVARGVGSCVAIAMLDRQAGVAALAHAMLPTARLRGSQSALEARHVDTAVPAVLAALERAGGMRSRVEVYLAGGSDMFEGFGAPNTMRIGERNAAAALAAVSEAGLRVVAAELGGAHGRVVEVQATPPHVACHAPLLGRDNLFAA